MAVWHWPVAAVPWRLDRWWRGARESGAGDGERERGAPETETSETREGREVGEVGERKNEVPRR